MGPMSACEHAGSPYKTTTRKARTQAYTAPLQGDNLPIVTGT